jgi:hypothetical protein
VPRGNGISARFALAYTGSWLWEVSDIMALLEAVESKKAG